MSTSPNRSHFNQEEPEPSHSGDEEPWLISYADLMTLLFGLFAMLYSAAMIDEGKAERVEKKLSQLFGGVYIQPTKLLAERLKMAWSKTPQGEAFEIKVLDDSIEIRLKSSVLFQVGSAELSVESKKILENLTEVLKSDQKRYRIQVEGHTDDVPIQSQRFPTNWELSGARASSLVRVFEVTGYPAEMLMAAGFGSTRPEVPNRDPLGKSIPENQALNRRVVIKVLPDILRKTASDGSEVDINLDAEQAPTQVPAETLAPGASL